MEPFPSDCSAGSPRLQGPGTSGSAQGLSKHGPAGRAELGEGSPPGPPPPPARSGSTHLIFSKLRDLFCAAVISPVLFLLV